MTRRVSAWVRLAPTLFLLAWGGNHFTPLLHLYEHVGHYTAWQANLLLTMYVAGLVPGLLVASAISDQHGRKPVVLAGVAIAILGSALLAAGTDVFLLLCAGRVFAGIGVGIAMSVGTSWMKELSSAPFDTRAGATAGARRPALTLTLGFGTGALVTGLLAQWGPAPTVLPFLLHAGLSSLALVPMASVPETLAARDRATGSWWRDLRVPAAGHHRFVRLVLPSAPWVFAAASVAYAVVPAAVDARLGQNATLYATILTVITLGSGAVVQNVVPAIHRATGGRALAVGLALMLCGMALAVLVAVTGIPWLGLIAAVVLGLAYGVCVVAGLIIVQQIATPRDLAGLTGVYYSLTYTGFLLPTILAALLPFASYAWSLSVVALVCAGSLVMVAARMRGGPAG